MKNSNVVYVPPRPNLDPEGFADQGIGAFTILSGFIIALGTASAIYIVLLRFQKRRKSSKASARKRLSESSISPADLASLVREVRGKLAERFGEGIRAKTTEELACDLTITELMGLEGSSNLIAFFRATDPMRFGSSGLDDPQRLLDIWSDWALDFCAAAGARSMTNGK